MAAAEEWLAGRVPKVQLMVRSDNLDATAFYERLGYERSDVTVLARWLAADRPPRAPARAADRRRS